MLIGDRCKYCKETMIGQDNDRMGINLYCKIYVCTNDKCAAVYEEWTDEKGRSISGRNRWFNPQTNEFED